MSKILPIASLAAACVLAIAAPQISNDAPGVTVALNGAAVLHRTGVGYPAAALRDRVQGTVSVQVKVDSRGEVSDAQVLSGPHFAAGHLLKNGTVSIGSMDMPQRNQALEEGLHFQQVDLPATEAIVINVPTEYPTLAPAERKVRVDARHPRSSITGVLDRALATFAGEQP